MWCQVGELVPSGHKHLSPNSHKGLSSEDHYIFFGRIEQCFWALDFLNTFSFRVEFTFSSVRRCGIGLLRLFFFFPSYKSFGGGPQRSLFCIRRSYKCPTQWDPRCAHGYLGSVLCTWIFGIGVVRTCFWSEHCAHGYWAQRCVHECFGSALYTCILESDALYPTCWTRRYAGKYVRPARFT